MRFSSIVDGRQNCPRHGRAAESAISPATASFELQSGRWDVAGAGSKTESLHGMNENLWDPNGNDGLSILVHTSISHKNF